MDLAVGGCEGTKGDNTIVRCDLCKAWYHITCGGVAIGDGMSTDESRDQTICRICARITIGFVQAKERSVSVQRQLAQVRERSKSMLAFLEEESRAGGGPLEGVIDLNVSRAGSSQAACRGWLAVFLFVLLGACFFMWICIKIGVC